MSNPRRGASGWPLAIFASAFIASCTPAQHLSTVPDRGGLEVRWQQPIAAADDVEQAPWLVVGAAAAFVAGPAVGLTAFDLAGDGALLWSSSHTSAVPPVVLGDVVITVADQELVAIRQDRDDVAWRTHLDAAPSSLWVVGDRLGVATAEELRIVDAHGTAGWRLALGALPSTPFMTESGVTFVGLESSELLAIDSAAGTIQWRIRLPAKPESLASLGTRLYVSAANGHLYSYEKTATPKPKWDYAKIRAIGQPVVDAHSAYFTLLNNVLYAFNQTFQHIGILSLEFHVDKLSRPLL